MSSGNRSEHICRDINYFSPIVHHLVVNFDKLFYSLIFFYFYLYFLFLPFWWPSNFTRDSWFTKTLVTSKKEMRLLIFMTSTHASSTEGRGQVRKEILVLQNISSERLYASDESSIWIGPFVLIYMFNICIPWAVKGRFMRKGRLAYSDSCAKRNLKYEFGVPLLSESSGSYKICLLVVLWWGNSCQTQSRWVKWSVVIRHYILYNIVCVSSWFKCQVKNISQYTQIIFYSRQNVSASAAVNTRNFCLGTVCNFQRHPIYK